MRGRGALIGSAHREGYLARKVEGSSFEVIKNSVLRSLVQPEASEFRWEPGTLPHDYFFQKLGTGQNIPVPTDFIIGAFGAIR